MYVRGWCPIAHTAKHSLFLQFNSTHPHLLLFFVFYRYKTQPVSSPSHTPLSLEDQQQKSPTSPSGRTLKTPVNRRQTQPVTPEEVRSAKQFMEPVKTSSSIAERQVLESFNVKFVSITGIVENLCMCQARISIVSRLIVLQVASAQHKIKECFNQESPHHLYWDKIVAIFHPYEAYFAMHADNNPRASIF